MKRFCHYLLSVLLALTSCSEAIDIDTGVQPVRCFVVDGMITDQMCHQVVRLSLSQGFYDPDTEVPWVSGAEVSVMCGEQTFEFEEDAAEPGTYRSVSAFKGETGRTYSLDVKATVGDRPSHFRAQDSVPAPGGQLDTLDYIYSKDMDNLWTLAIWGRDYLDMRSRYLIRVGINGHFKPFEKSVELPDDHFNGMSFSGFTLAALHHTEEFWKIYGESFKPLEKGDVITMRAYCLSEGYGEFLMKYSHFIFGTIPLLTDQPTDLITNITGTEPAVGYFGACAVIEVSCTVDDPYRTEFLER